MGCSAFEMCDTHRSRADRSSGAVFLGRSPLRARAAGICALGAVSLALAACASGPTLAPEDLPEISGGFVQASAPEWCLGESRGDVISACASQSIRTAGGRGQAKAAATEMAFTAVARQLEARVTSELTTRQRTESFGGRSQVSRTIIEKAVISVEDLPIIGLREARSSVGDAGASVYVLAELDRRASEREILRAIVDTDTRIAQLAPSLETRDRLTRARALYPAFALQARRLELDRQLALVGIATKRVARPNGVDTVLNSAVETLDTLSIGLAPQGGNAEALRRDLREALRKEGGLRLQDADDADVVIDFAVQSSENYESTARIYTVTADVTGTIRDRSGRNIGGFQHATRGFGPSVEAARRSISAELAEKMAQDMTDAILG